MSGLQAALVFPPACSNVLFLRATEELGQTNLLCLLCQDFCYYNMYTCMSLSPLGTRWPGQNHKGNIISQNILPNNARKPGQWRICTPSGPLVTSHSTETYEDGMIECFSNWKIGGMRNHWHFMPHVVKSQSNARLWRKRCDSSHSWWPEMSFPSRERADWSFKRIRYWHA